MGGVFKSIKDLFVESDDKSVKKAESVAKSEKSASVAETQAQALNTDIVSDDISAHGEVSEKFLDLLFSELEENNLEGFDYLEYKKALQNLKKMDHDEKTQFQSAFATASIIGTTKDKLISSVHFYINILAKEEEKFDAAWQKQSEGQIGGKRKRKAQLEKAVQDKEAKMAKLQEEVVEHKIELSKMDEQLKDISSKINKTKQDFQSSYKYLVNQLEQDIEKMKLYLK